MLRSFQATFLTQQYHDEHMQPCDTVTKIILGNVLLRSFVINYFKVVINTYPTLHIKLYFTYFNKSICSLFTSNVVCVLQEKNLFQIRVQIHQKSTDSNLPKCIYCTKSSIFVSLIYVSKVYFDICSFGLINLLRLNRNLDELFE